MEVSKNLKKFLNQPDVQEFINNKEWDLLINETPKLNHVDTWELFRLLDKVRFDSNLEELVNDYYRNHADSIWATIIAFLSTDEVSNYWDLVQTNMWSFRLEHKAHMLDDITLDLGTDYIYMNEGDIHFDLDEPIECIDDCLQALTALGVNLKQYRWGS